MPGDAARAVAGRRLELREALLLALCAATAVLLLEVLALRTALTSYGGVLRHGGTAALLWLQYAAAFAACVLPAWLGLHAARVQRAPALAGCALALAVPAALYVLLLGSRMPILSRLPGSGAWLVVVTFAGAGASLLAAARYGGGRTRAAALGLTILAIVAAYAALQHLTGRVPAELARAPGRVAALAALALGVCLPLLAVLVRGALRPAARPLAAALALLLAALVGAVAYEAPAPALPTQSRATTTRPPRAPPVLLIVADTLRADFVSALGGPPGTTPHLDALARDGIAFERARSPAPWTTPAFASLFTSTYPARHRAGERRGGVLRRRGMDHSLPTLAEALAARGYLTGALLSNTFLDRSYRLARGFQRYQNYHAVEWYHPVASLLQHRLLRAHADPYIKAYLTAGQQTPRVVDALRALVSSGRPWLLLAHYMDAHRPYIAPRRFRDGAAPDLRAAYAAEVRHLDHHVGRVLDALRALGVYEDVLIVFTSDHGEELLEARQGGASFDHGHTLFEELLRVPLIVKLPGGRRAGTRRADPVSLLDVAPTILGALGIPPPPTFDGVDLLAEAGAAEAPRTHFAESLLQVPERKAAVRGDAKVVLRRLPPAARHVDAYDLRADPAERSPLPIASDPARYEPLYRALAARAAHAPGAEAPPAAPPLDAFRREQLEALGYGQ